MPLEGASLTSGYGMRTHPVLGGRRQHAGIDLAAPTGTPVYATADGVVGRADWYSSYGLYIAIEHGAAMQTRYAHLSRLAVAAGDNVKKGDLIGYVGSTGRSTGRCATSTAARDCSRGGARVGTPSTTARRGACRTPAATTRPS
jgi:murein DD-endopeptidase MepM/ murein hydrolase activator NlpD